MFRVMWDNFDEAFDIFDNTTAQIARVDDYDDYEGTFTLHELGMITGDLQPYSSALLERDYGFKKECQKRFFCRKHESIAEGVRFIIGNQNYEAVSVIEWEGRMCVMLKEVSR